MKFCYRRKENKSRESFCKDKNRGDGLNYICKACASAKDKKYRTANPEISAKRTAKWRNKNIERSRKVNKRSKYKNSYNISEQQTLELLSEQNHSCKICRLSSDELAKDLCLDHNHLTGEIRGFLCDNCNKGLGQFKDNVRSIKAAIIYLSQDKYTGIYVNADKIKQYEGKQS